MKIVVTSKGETQESEVDQRFGRARYFMRVDTETGAWSAHDNTQNFQAAQGSGVQAAQKVFELEADAVITGHCGPNAYQTLSAGDVAVYTGASGTVQDAVEALKAGTLNKANDADVESHFGQ